MITHEMHNNIFFRRAGFGRNQDIFYIHGLGESGLCFEKIISSPLLSEYNHFVMDLPGYGRSPAWNTVLRLSEYADLVHDWIHQFIQRPVVMIGHSMGGVIGQLLAENFPGSLSHFINIEGNISIGDCTFSGRAAAYSQSVFVDSGFDRLKEAVSRNGHQNAALLGYHTSMSMANPQQFYLNSLELISYSRPEDLARRFVDLPMPAVYIAGTPGGACDRSKELLRLSKARLIEISPAGHWPFIDQSDVFIGHLLQFLNSDRSLLVSSQKG
jgi:pimeloyl-ACP methyl ester carboxylesterase